MTRAKLRSSSRRWPWGVARVWRRSGKVTGWWIPGHVSYLAQCDCGWRTWRRRRRPAATALANHTHLPPNPFRGGSR